jgi:hypothetical protein
MKRAKTGATGPSGSKRPRAAAGAVGCRDRLGTAEPPALAGLTGDIDEAASGAGGGARPAEASTVERPGDVVRRHAPTSAARPGPNRLSLGHAGQVHQHRRKSITERRRFTYLQLVPHTPAKFDGLEEKAGPADGPDRVREAPSSEGGRRLRLASGASMHVRQARSRAD